MPVDAQVQAIIDGMSAGGVSEFAELGHLAVRELCESMLLPFEAGELSSIEDRVISLNDAAIPVRIYTPLGSGPFPVVMYFHGGGWTIGSLNTHDPICRALSTWSACVVVSVHYRLAPEFPFPIPLEDCYAATQYVQQHAVAFGIDPSRLAVAGDSAGGNLATEVCILARDRQFKGEPAPKIIYQLLFYPITDSDFETASYRENAFGYVLRRSDMQWFWDQYMPEPEKRKNPYATPLCANLENLPPAMVITAEYDTLRDEGNAYAKKLQTAGVSVIHREVPGMIHGFIGFAALVDKGKKLLKECAKELALKFSLQS